MKIERFGIYSQTILLVGLLLSSLFYLDFVQDKTLSPRLFLLSFFMLLYVATFAALGAKLTFQFHIFSILLILFTIYVFVSGFQATNLAVYFVESSKILLFTLLFLVVVSHLNHPDFKTNISKFVLLLFLFSTIWFVIQLFSIENYARKNLYEIVGISGHKNLYASFISFCFMLSLYGVNLLRNKWKVLSIFSMALMLFILFFLQTRAVWLGLFVFVYIMFFLFLIKKRVKTFSMKNTYVTFVLLMILFNVFLIFIMPFLTQHSDKKIIEAYDIENVTDLGTFRERMVIWQKTYEVIDANFWLGVGADNWKVVHTKFEVPDVYKVTDKHVIFQRPHNDLLWIFSEYGIIGMNLFLAFVFLQFAFLLKLFLSKGERSVLILASSIVAITVISFFDFPKERVEHMILIVIIYAISIRHILDSKEIRYITVSNHTIVTKSFVIGLLCTVVILFFNLKGDMYFFKLYEARMKSNHSLVIQYGQKMNKVFYNLDHTSVPIDWYVGNAYASLGHYDSAFQSFKSAYQYAPYNPYVLNDLGSAFYYLQEVDSAIFYFLKSTKINKRFNEPKLNLMALYINEEKFEEALYWNETITSDSERRSYYLELINTQRGENK